MRNIFISILFLFSYNLFSQDFGVQIGLTTSTPTGNLDSYDFDFLESFSPGYEAGFFGRFRLSDVIIIKPELSYREYSTAQKINLSFDSYYLKQTHRGLSIDVNCDVELNNYMSFVFGLGADYILHIHTVKKNDDIEELNNLDLSGLNNNERITPFNNVGLSLKIGRRLIIDLEYRHLLENLSLGDLVNGELISLERGGVKLHMINFCVGIIL